MSKKVRRLALSCDLEDPASVSVMVERILEHMNSLETGEPYVEIDASLPYQIKVIRDETFQNLVVTANDNEFIGEAGPRLSQISHRALKVERPVGGQSKAQVALTLLAIHDALEGPLFEENVRGYDLIIFHIRRGMVPDLAQPHLEDLKFELVAYLKRKKEGDGEILSFERHVLPNVKLVHCPGAAVIYLEELKHLSGYTESGN